MWILQTVFAVLLIAGAYIGVLLLQRRIRGNDTPLFTPPQKKQIQKGPNELEAFVAAYRGGKIDSGQLAAPAAPAESKPPVQGAPAPALGALGASLATPATGAFLRPEVKLGYLSLRAGLRDHHVFANVRLSDLGRGETPGRIDLLVCDTQFAPVAAIDIGAAATPDNAPAKTAFLREAGIRYLRLNARAMPKPAEIKTLIYRA
ncbi:MAG: hypothetical protein ACREUQ_06975 [Burkholderiales bacterium]